jgi:peptidoglycan-associated lipoprotein
MHRPYVIALTAASVALVAGCASDPKPGPRMAAATTTTATDAPRGTAQTARPVRQDTATPTSGSIHIDDRILKACGNIPLAHFAFDSAAVQPEAQGALDALARCFSNGPLAGRSMLLTGHTDPRGETEYNMALGQRRAGSVANYLTGRALPRAHVSTTSRGEFDATGTDEEGWARDRKVNVTLVE